jgi:flagellin-like protein
MSTHKEVQKRMRMLRSRKALSPVVASIILIAVTVAVSIAVAAWMGALTFTFMATEQIQITNLGFGPGSGNGWIAVTVNNTGTSPVTINEAWVNNIKKTTTTPSLPSGGTIAANKGLVLNITSLTVTRGNNYQVKLVSSKGNQFLYSAYAPGS